MDTVSFAWRSARALESLLALGPVKAEPGSFWLRHPPPGIRLGAFPAHDLVVAEGRAAPMLSGEASDHRLISAKLLPSAAARVAKELAVRGVAVNSSPSIRRCDPAAELRFDDGAEGLLFLEAWAAGVRVPGYKQDVWSSADGTRVETAYWRTPRRGEIKGRMYDAGQAHSTDAPGHRLRLERQVRYRKREQPIVHALTETDPRSFYLGPLERWLATSHRVTVASPDQAVEAVFALRATGDASPAKAERIIGTLQVLSRRRAAEFWNARTLQRRLAELRDLGLALDLSCRARHVSYDMRPPLEALADLWVGWGK